MRTKPSRLRASRRSVLEVVSVMEPILHGLRC